MPCKRPQCKLVTTEWANGPKGRVGTAVTDASDDKRERRRARRQARLAKLDSSIASPCIKVCQVNDAAGWCVGCFRSLDEIREWPIMTAEDKTGVLARIADRRAAPRG